MGYDEHGPAYPDGPTSSGWENVCKRKRTDGPTPCLMGVGCDCLEPTNKRRWSVLMILALGFAIGLFVGVHLAHGQEYYEPMEMPQNHHPAADAPLHEQFYYRWMQKDHPMVSCCNLGDCYPTIARPGVNTQWAYQRREDNAWIDVPDEKVEDRKEFQAPDGRAHVCAPDPKKWPNHAPITYCFHPPRSM